MASEEGTELDETSFEVNRPHDVYSQFVRITSSLTGSEVLWDAAWKQFEKATEQCMLEGRDESWIACAVYSALSLQQQIGLPPNYNCSLTDILKACDVSPLEFFDKMNRWKEIMSSPRRLTEQVMRMQSSLSISAVVFKRYVPIFRTFFVQMEDCDVDSLRLFNAIWLAFLLLKKQYVCSCGEELIAMFHLLLCTIEMFFKDLCTTAPDLIQHDLLNVEAEMDVLELMCRQFNGVVLDAKHLRTHWFCEKVHGILGLENPARFIDNFDHYSCTWTGEYEERLAKKGELDERLFSPINIQELFHHHFALRVVDELRRSLGHSGRLFDAHYLMRISTQGCLNKLTDKNVVSPNTLTVNTEQSSPTNLLSISEHKLSKLGQLIPEGWKLTGTELEKILQEVRDPVLPTIQDTLGTLVSRLDEVILEEEETCAIRDDSIRDHLTSMATTLFYRLLENIALTERDRTKDYEFANMFRKEELLTSLFAISLEIIFDTYGSERRFPWCLHVFKLPAVTFYKVIEIVVKAEGGLARETVRHLSMIEESVLEELAWSLDSPLWSTLQRRADGVPSSESIWALESEKKALSQQYSPVKKRRGEDGRVIRTGHTAASFFFRKVYLLAAARLCDLCDRMKMDEKTKQKVWTVFEHSLRTQTSLYAGRHLDQNLMCIVYVVSRVSKLDVSFHEIMQLYRQQPQATPRVYREVFVESSQLPPHLIDDTESLASGAFIDLIKYYNHVFVTRVEHLVSRLESNEGAVQLLNFPSLPSQIGSPTKKILTNRVSVSPLPSLTASPNAPVRTLKYNMAKSPVKDLKTINKVIRRSTGPVTYMASSAVPSRPISQLSYRY